MNWLKGAFVAQALLALPTLVLPGASAQTIQRIDLVEYGRYELQIVRKEAEPGSAAGSKSIVSQIRRVEQTARIPARLGTHFGLKFRVVGSPDDAPVALEQRWRFPAPGLRNPQTDNTYRTASGTLEALIGVERFRGYGFDHQWELVPGDWTMEIWSGERKLLSQTFTIYSP